MAITFLNDHNCATFHGLKIWAERGLVHIEDARDNSYRSVSVRTSLERTNALNDMVRNSLDRSQRVNSYLDNVAIEEHQRFIERMVTIMQQAQEQGMPSDASARRDLVRRRARSVVIPGLKSAM